MSRRAAGSRPGKKGLVRDFDLWTAVGRTVDPLHRRKSADPRLALDQGAEDKTLEPVPAPRFARPVLPSERPLIKASQIAPSQKLIEPNLKRRLARGHEPIDATLDLHGMTQIQAHSALEGFIARSLARGDRTLLVITGKGIKKTGYLQLGHKGVLRDMVPLWLNAPAFAPFIAGIDPAHRQHGGGGALYVRLKRRREP